MIARLGVLLMLASVSLAVEAVEDSKQGAAPPGAAPASAQTGEMSGRTDSRPNKWGYNYPQSIDAEIAAPKVHRVPFQDEHVMLMEVSNPPGYAMQMHGHPYPSVSAMSALLVRPGGPMPMKDTKLDPKSSMNGQNWRGAKPKGAPLPVCMSADPQAPHEPLNVSDVPMHFWRVEFKQIDQDDTAGMKARYAKAPLHKTLHETEDMRFVEVTIQPGGKDPGSADALPRVLAFDTVAAFEALSAVEDANAGRSEAPVGMVAPRCIAAADKGAPEVLNTSELPLHYYRIEFKRMDGEGLAANWRMWYPHMVEMLEEQQSKAMTADEEQVNALEQRRLAAINAGDVAALRGLLTDDYIHVHQIARVDDRETYLQAIRKTPRRTERGPLTIRVYGDLAVLTGEQRNTLVTPIPGIGPLQPTMCTEVAVRQNGKWRFVSTQTTPMMQPGDPAPKLPQPEDVTKEKQGPLTAGQQELVALESRRAAAIAKNDFAALTKLLSDDYIHVYGSGKVGDRAGYIEQLKSGPRSYTRGPLTVHLYGDSAVVSGWLINSIRFPNQPEMTYQVMVVQVAHRVNGNWQFVSQHMTPKMDLPMPKPDFPKS